MSGWLALAALVAAVATIPALLCALALAGLMPWLRPRLEAAAMSGRTGLLVIVAALPLMAGGVLVAACLAPSAMVKLGLGGDHCLVHLDHALHLCLHHLPNIAPTFTVGIVVAGGAALAASATWRAGMLMLRGRNEAQSLASIAEQRNGVWWIESRLPVALTVGLVQPEVYVSSGLAIGLHDVELRAAIAHERCHARERHALLKMFATVAAMFQLPATRREVISLLDLACERRADESAAAEVTDRLRVASALIRAHRLGLHSHSPAVMAFADGSRSRLDRRVRALLDEPAGDTRHSWSSWVIGSTLVVAVVANHELHHAVEHMLALLV